LFLLFHLSSLSLSSLSSSAFLHAASVTPGIPDLGGRPWPGRAGLGRLRRRARHGRVIHAAPRRDIRHSRQHPFARKHRWGDGSWAHTQGTATSGSAPKLSRQAMGDIASPHMRTITQVWPCFTIAAAPFATPPRSGPRARAAWWRARSRLSPRPLRWTASTLTACRTPSPRMRRPRLTRRHRRCSSTSCSGPSASTIAGWYGLGASNVGCIFQEN
jgi:hypothetical protein